MASIGSAGEAALVQTPESVHQHRAKVLQGKIHGLVLNMTQPLGLVMKHYAGRHLKYAEQKQANGGVYDEELEAMSLVNLVPTDFDEACRVHKRIVRRPTQP